VLPILTPVTPGIELVLSPVEQVLPVVAPVTPVLQPVVEPVTPILQPIIAPVSPILEPEVPVSRPITPVIEPPTPDTSPVYPPVQLPSAPIIPPARPILVPLLPVVQLAAERGEPVLPVVAALAVAPARESASPELGSLLATSERVSVRQDALLGDRTTFSGERARLEIVTDSTRTAPAPNGPTSVFGLAQAIGGVRAPPLGHQALSSVGTPVSPAPPVPTQAQSGASLAAVVSALSYDSPSGERERFARLVDLPSSLTQTVPVPPG